VPAKEINMPCGNTYECQTVTQGTLCVRNGTKSTCQCDSRKYFNNIDKKCQDQLLEDRRCTQPDACRSDLGLSCQNNLCKCGANQYWNGASCVNILSYNQGQCNTDSQCKGELICRASTSCACPLTVSSKYCDCPPRTIGKEFYWNGNDCVLANTYGGACNNSAQYMCQVNKTNLIFYQKTIMIYLYGHFWSRFHFFTKF
jgi:hypothetical protein